MIRCPRCGKQFDPALLQFEQRLKCTCGNTLNVSMIDSLEDFTRYAESVEEREHALEIQEEANRICQMILDENCPEVDIEIAKGKLRERVIELFPDKVGLYEMIYESRFKRLWEQFRG